MSGPGECRWEPARTHREWHREVWGLQTHCVQSAENDSVLGS